MTYAQLDPLAVPLEGLRLIEASAGTGKTWVIAALYVRAVLGHGGQPARIPPEILVVTFTRDATSELRERIRARLEEAAVAFRAGRSTDDFLAALMKGYESAAARAAAARQLEVAAQWMDEAAIHTIHGWANRMLTRHAFDSGRSLVEAIEADPQALLAEACRDYWRREVYPLSAAHFNEVRAAFSAGPDALAKAVGPLLARQISVSIEGAAPASGSLADALNAAFASAEATLKAARLAWREHLQSLQAVQGELEGGLSAAKKAGKRFSNSVQALAAWIEGEALALSSEDLRLLGEVALRDALKRGKVLPPCSAYAAAEQLAELIEHCPSAQSVVLQHALRALPPVIQSAKAIRGEIGYDDMLSELERALSGPQGPHLAATLRAQLPLAMIDEFQDTDPLQWRIFQHIYGEAGALLLIGDPKQSIYGFRGADIGTYFRARDVAARPVLTLTRNYRSTEALVGAVNALFEHGDAVSMQGAFGYGIADRGLPFHPVEAEGRGETWLEGGAAAASLVFAVPAMPAILNKGDYIERMAEAAAERIASWLSPASTARIETSDGRKHRVKPSDIAVLVRTGSEADRLRSALRRRGLASAYLSDKQSVYASEEARDLQHWLETLASPGSDRALRAALATASAAFDFAAIDRIANDDIERDRYMEIFATGGRLWRERGVLAAVRHLIHALDIPARLASSERAERALTNLLHVAELLQHAAVHLDGEHALIRHLGDAIASADAPESDASSALVQRLESEADLVRVITIHKSKGLQYRLVLLPFACSFRDIDGRKDRYFEFERADARVLSLEATPEAVEGARLAMVREAVRLFYVAVTRAELACWIGVGAVQDGQKKTNGAPLSGLGRLLGGGADLDGEGVLAALDRLRARSSAIAVEALPEPVPSTRVAAPAPLAALAQARRVTAPRAPAWWLSSYSSLVRGSGRSSVDAASAAEAVPLEEYVASRLESRSEARAGDMHAFPRGAAYGSFLHYLLEWAALIGFDRVCEDTALLAAELGRRANAAGLSDWVDVLQAWLPGFLQTPLPLPDGSTVALRQLAQRQIRPEFAFMIEANATPLAAVDAVVGEHLLPGLARPPLTQVQLNGLLSGFIDLVFEHDGAWYTLDYKSNHLAEDSAGYTAAAMADEMLHHRYDLQAALYLLALHRFLRARLPGYDPRRHIGGVIYPFLRGVGPDTGVFVARPDVAMLDALDALFAGGRADAD